MANNFELYDARGHVTAMRTIERDGVHTPYHQVGSVDKKFRDSFAGMVLNADKWDSLVGNGASISLNAGTLVLNSGTTANAETWVLSKEHFTVPFRVSFNVALSQRIADQVFIVEAVSIDPETGLPDGQHAAAFVFDGTTATTAKYRVQSSGLAPLDSAAVTVVTSVGTGLYEIEPFPDECWFHSGTLDATTGRANSYRRHQQIPDPNALYKVRIRWLNGAVAPASATTATLQFLAVQDYQELTAEVTSGRGQSVAGQAIAVQVAGTASVISSLTPSTSYGATTFHHLISAASVNATAVKTSAGSVNSVTVSNVSSSVRYFKMYNKASAPISADTPVRVVAVQPNTTISVDTGSYGLRHSTGISYQITGGIANNDATAIGANEVIVAISYT